MQGTFFNIQQEILHIFIFQQIDREIELHRNLAHPHVVRFMSFFEDDASVYIVLEYCSKKVGEIPYRLLVL